MFDFFFPFLFELGDGGMAGREKLKKRGMFGVLFLRDGGEVEFMGDKEEGGEGRRGRGGGRSGGWGGGGGRGWRGSGEGEEREES